MQHFFQNIGVNRLDKRYRKLYISIDLVIESENTHKKS